MTTTFKYKCESLLLLFCVCDDHSFLASPNYRQDTWMLTVNYWLLDVFDRTNVRDWQMLVLFSLLRAAVLH